MSFPLIENSRWEQLPRELNKEVQSYLNPREIAARTQLVCQRWHMSQDDLAGILISLIRSRRGVFSGDELQKWTKQGLTERLIAVGQIPRIMGAIQTLKVQNYYPWLQLQNALQLKELDCCSANLSDAEIRNMTVFLPSVQILNFSGCAFLGDQGFLTIMGNYPNVHSLGLYSNVTDDGLETIIRFYNYQIQVIEVPFSRITDDGFSKIAKYCPKLKNLMFNFCQITDRGLESLAQLSNLKILNLRDTETTDRGLESLANLTSLEQLDFGNCWKITDRGLESLAQLSSLEELDLSKCQEITNHGLQHLANLPHLKKLNLSGCRQITGDGMQALMSQLPNLVIQ